MLEYILANNPDGKSEETGRIGEDSDADVLPIQLKRVGKKWKLVAY